MPGYDTHQQLIRLGDRKYRIRSLTDIQQFADPDGHAERLGISSAQWCLFGQVWPAGRSLAEAMSDFDVAGKRILEVGCGLGLASLVLQQRGADIVASDLHPLAEPFLAYNSALNGLPSVVFRHLDWGLPLPTLGRFDMIIGSDVLYEPEHTTLLAALLERHAHTRSEVLITDPGRGHRAVFTRALIEQGYSADEQRMAMSENDLPPYRGRLLYYRRGFDDRAPSTSCLQ